VQRKFVGCLCAFFVRRFIETVDLSMSKLAMHNASVPIVIDHDALLSIRRSTITGRLRLCTQIW
jgi:hypothetical protein